MFSAQKGRIRYQDVERELPPRLRKEPKPGDNPLKRPYPPHRRDAEVLDYLLQGIPKDIPTEFVERDKRTATRPQGVLYFHVLDIQSLKLAKKDFIHGAPFCIYVEYECQGVIKCSYPVNSFTQSKIRIDHYSHFSAEVSESRMDEANDFVIHVYAFQNPEKHWLIGSQLLHMFHFVRDIHGINTINIQDDLKYEVGRVTFEFSWAYGSFGYGYSNQLLNTKNPVNESVCHSMFPRIAPSTDDLIDNNFRVRMPKRLRLVNLHSLLVRVPLSGKGKGKESGAKPSKKDFDKEAKTLIFRRVKFSRGRPIHVALNLDIHQKFMENDFNQTYGEFLCLRNRKERLQHLTRMMDGRLRDRFEGDATGLYFPIKEVKDCREGLGIKKPLACPPGYLEHKLHPHTCPPKPPVKLSTGEKQFISEITSAPRFSGYLVQVFGYQDGEVEKLPIENHEYKVDRFAFLGGGVCEEDNKTLFQSFVFHFKRFWYRILLFFILVWDYIFPSPDFEKNANLLPEISVTLPSPADSTTEFYAHCVQEKVYPPLDDLTQIKRQATQLVRQARRKNTYYDEDHDDTDEDEWQTEPELEVPERVQKPNVRRIRDHRALGTIAFV